MKYLAFLLLSWIPLQSMTQSMSIYVGNNSNHNTTYFESGISGTFSSTDVAVTVEGLTSLPTSGISNYNLMILATHGRNVSSNYENFDGFLWSDLNSSLSNWITSGGTLFIADDTESDYQLFDIFNIQLLNATSGVTILEQDIYSGSYGNIPQNNWTGDKFSHTVVTSVSAGYSLETLIEDEFGNAIVGAVEYGNGQIIFSGMTGIPHQGGGDYNATTLWNNLVDYAIETTPIPEPSSYALLLGGLALGLVALRRR